MRHFLLKAVLVSLIPAGLGISHMANGNEKTAISWLGIATAWLLLNIAAAHWLLPELEQDEKDETSRNP